MPLLDRVLADWNADLAYKIRNDNLAPFFAQVRRDSSRDSLNGGRGRDRFFANEKEDLLIRPLEEELIN